LPPNRRRNLTNLAPPERYSKSFLKHVAPKKTRQQQIKKKDLEARTGVIAGFQGPNAGAKRKRFDEATMLCSGINVEVKSKFAENFQSQRLFRRNQLFLL